MSKKPKQGSRPVRDLAEFAGKPPALPSETSAGGPAVAPASADAELEAVAAMADMEDRLAADYKPEVAPGPWTTFTSRTVDYDDADMGAPDTPDAGPAVAVADAPPVLPDAEASEATAEEIVRQAIESAPDIDPALLGTPLKQRRSLRRSLFGQKSSGIEMATCWCFTGTDKWGVFDGAVKMPRSEVPENSPHYRVDPGLMALLGQPEKVVNIVTKDASGNYAPGTLELVEQGSHYTPPEGGSPRLVREPTPEEVYEAMECKAAEMMYHIAPTTLQQIRTYIWLAALGILALLLFLIFASITEGGT